MTDQAHVPRREFDDYQVPEEWETDEEEDKKRQNNRKDKNHRAKIL